MKYTTQSANQNLNQNITRGGSSINSMGMFSEQVSTVTNLFEGWNDCERTVVMYALLKRLRYPSLKFLHYSIDHTLTQNMGSQPHLSSVVIDINANNPSYLQNLLNAYKTLHLNEACDMLSSGSLDKDSIPCYGSDFQITHCDERKLNRKKEEILHEVLDMVPLLKPGNDDAKATYLALMPAAVKDTMRQRVPTELVQQIFSYLLIHPAISTDDRRSLTCCLHQLEEHIHATNKPLEAEKIHQNSYTLENNKDNPSDSSTTSFSSSASCSSVSNNSVSSSGSNAVPVSGTQIYNAISRNVDWQTIAPPSKAHHNIQQHPPRQSKSLHDWSSILVKGNSFTNVANLSSSSNGSRNNRGSGGIADQLCDNLNGINLTELGSSQNSLGLSGITSIGGESNREDAALVNGVAAAVTVSASLSGGQCLFSGNNNPIISIINTGNRDSSGSGGSSTLTNSTDEHDTSFSKNGTEIIDFEPNANLNGSDGGSSSGSNNSQIQGGDSFLQQKSLPLPFTTILMANCEPMDMARWSLDGKLASLKTRRSNSLTTQAISTSSSSSNSSVVTVNDACSNSTENLAQFANKPRSFSLSIEHQRSGLTNSGSDTRLDEYKPNYIKFQTRNIGMSNIGLWLKSLRLHKYIELFKDMTYEDMMQITEDYLQSLGVTKGASHKLALCIEKLKERVSILGRIEQDLLNGHIKLQLAVEDLANMVLTPMKPIEAVNSNAGEENVALQFLHVVDIVISLMQKDPGNPQDDESSNILMWILDRSIHNEIFASRTAQLKELKFKLSKLKMAIGHKMHHIKNGSGGNLNKSRWSGKARKCDGKNGSNDRINHRKNSNDMLNFSMTGLSQQHHHNNHQQQQAEYDKFSQILNNSTGSHHQYKSSSYPNFMNNQHQQPKQQTAQHHHQQAQQLQQPHQPKMQQPMMQQLAHYSTLPTQQQQPPQQQTQQQQPQQHRRSLNNLIVVPGGPQQPQKMIFKPGQGIMPAGGSPGDNQSRRTSLTTSLTNQTNGNGNVNGNLSNNLDASQSQLQQQSQPHQPKKSMTSVVMDNFSKFDDHFTLF